jgi:hypothetical protein
MHRKFELICKQVETWQMTELTDATAKVVIFEGKASRRVFSRGERTDILQFRHLTQNPKLPATKEQGNGGALSVFRWKQQESRQLPALNLHDKTPLRCVVVVNHVAQCTGRSHREVLPTKQQKPWCVGGGQQRTHEGCRVVNVGVDLVAASSYAIPGS